MQQSFIRRANQNVTHVDEILKTRHGRLVQISAVLFVVEVALNII